MKKKRNYVDNSEMYIEMCFWKLKRYAFDSEVIKPSDSIGEAIRLTTEGLARHKSFRRYTSNWKEDMIASGITSMIKGIWNFNEQKYTNIHSYMTRSAKNAFLQTKEKEDKELLTTYSMYLDEHRDFVPMDYVDEKFVQDLSDKASSIKESIERKKHRRKLMKMKREITPLDQIVYDNYEQRLDEEIKKTETFYTSKKIEYGERGRILITVERLKKEMGIELGSICVGDVIEFLSEKRQMEIDENMKLGCSVVDINFVVIDGVEFVDINWGVE